jgi:hypothetical protein
MTNDPTDPSLMEAPEPNPTEAQPVRAESSLSASEEPDLSDTGQISPAAPCPVPETPSPSDTAPETPLESPVPADEAGPPPEVPPGPDLLVAAARETAQKTAELELELKRSKALQRLFEDLLSFRDKGWSLHLKSLCEREAELLKPLREQDHPCVSPLEDLYRQAKQRAGRMATIIPSEIEPLAKASGIEIDPRSRHPLYRFDRDGFLEAKIDDRKLTCTIRTREGKLATFPADPATILETVRVESRRLFGRKFNGEQFLSDLRGAYLAAIKTRKDAYDGDSVPIREVHAEMVKKAKNYKSDEFLVDLSTLVVQGPAETADFRFDLQQTKDTQEGMLLLGAAGRGMVNLLVFKKSNSAPS